ncbi:replication-associated recombination protein A [Acetobacteraceae bacterium]|nr:replication-associated recombination protein A [Acetobacteraceae bacterium]
MDDLFGEAEKNSRSSFELPSETSSVSRGRQPLADRLRPRKIDEICGQEELLGAEGRLRRMLEGKFLPSLILWGPPGCGKTTLARLLAEEMGLNFIQISAVFSGVSDLKKVFAQAEHQAAKGTLLFVDEIHRFNRAQQDGFLPYVENGVITLVGATTENPSFALNPALLSRCQVLVLQSLETDSLLKMLERAEELLERSLPLNDQARKRLVEMADGDGRYLLNLAEQVFFFPKDQIFDVAALEKRLSRRALRYDKSREEHYNLISAFHKSIRGSDPDAALYWYARMIEGGEDPRYIARRLVVIASEDVGEAAPGSLPLVIAAAEAFERLGSPEGELALAQAIVHLATAPKSNSVYKALKQARAVAKQTGSLMPPPHILNAPTSLMREVGYGEGYQYDHDQEGAFSGQDYFPKEMGRVRFYEPSSRGYEVEIDKRLKILEERRVFLQNQSQKNSDKIK